MWPFPNWRMEAMEHTLSIYGRKIDDLYKKVMALQKAAGKAEEPKVDVGAASVVVVSSETLR